MGQIQGCNLHYILKMKNKVIRLIPDAANIQFNCETNGVTLQYFEWTLSIVTRWLGHFRRGTITCRLSFSCGISILNLWTGSKSCCWLNWCCCCCNEVGCCNPGWGIGPPGCCWEAILTDYENKPEEDLLYIRFIDSFSK